MPFVPYHRENLKYLVKNLSRFRSGGSENSQLQRTTECTQCSPTQTKEFLKRIGLKLRKVGHVPGKALNPDKIQEQEHFQKNKLEPRLEEAKEGKRSLFL